MIQNFNTGLKQVAAHYLKLLNAKVTATSIKKDIEENPNYPSLLSLSDVFSKYHIPNNAFEIPSKNFEQIECPFVAFTDIPGEGKDFVLVTHKNNNTVRFFYKRKKAELITRKEFLTRYQNIIWVAEPDERSGEADYAEKLRLEQRIKAKKIIWRIGLVSILFSAFIINIYVTNYFFFSAIALLKLAGTATAIFLLIHEIDKNNVFVKSLCNAGGHANCNAVLASKGAKIIGLSWSEIGFFYFAATTLYLFFPSVSKDTKTAFIALGNIFTTPYIIFSIYYQWRIAKQWCPLCLTVQAILFLELIWSSITFWIYPHHFPFSLENVLTPVQALAITVVAWYWIKPLIIKAKDAEIYKPAYKRLQYNTDIFKSLLRQQPKAPEGWQDIGINVGNPYATTTIIKVCNPYCDPCAKAHPQLEEIINRNDDVQLKIIFTAKNNVNDPGTLVVRHFMAIVAEGSASKIQQALDDWYLAKDKDYKKFALKYPVNGELPQLDDKIDAMGTWCKEAQITHTPTIFINQNKLPEHYSMAELKNIL